MSMFFFLIKVVIPDPRVGLGAHRGVYDHIFHTGLSEFKKKVSWRKTISGSLQRLLTYVLIDAFFNAVVHPPVLRVTNDRVIAKIKYTNMTNDSLFL